MESVTFSKVIGLRSALDISADATGSSVAIGQVLGDARAVLWGQDNLFEPAVSNSSEGQELQTRIIGWMFATD